MSTYRLKGTAGPVTNRSWPLESRAVIGGDAGATIHLDSGTVASSHAELIVGDGQISLKLIAEGGELFVNGAPVKETLLSSGDEIRIGNCRWMLQAPGLRPQKVLTEDAVRKRNRWLPWVIVGGLAAAGAAAWWLGYLPF